MTKIGDILNQHYGTGYRTMKEGSIKDLDVLLCNLTSFERKNNQMIVKYEVYDGDLCAEEPVHDPLPDHKVLNPLFTFANSTGITCVLEEAGPETRNRKHNRYVIHVEHEFFNGVGHKIGMEDAPHLFGILEHQETDAKMYKIESICVTAMDNCDFRRLFSMLINIQPEGFFTHLNG